MMQYGASSLHKFFAVLRTTGAQSQTTAASFPQQGETFNSGMVRVSCPCTGGGLEAPNQPSANHAQQGAVW